MAVTPPFGRCQSWGNCSFTWLLLPQRQLPALTSVNPNENTLKSQGIALIRSNTTDYTGVMFVYHRAQAGNLAMNGGWGVVNGLTMYMVLCVCVPLCVRCDCVTVPVVALAHHTVTPVAISNSTPSPPRHHCRHTLLLDSFAMKLDTTLATSTTTRIGTTGATCGTLWTLSGTTGTT